MKMNRLLEVEKRGTGLYLVVLPAEVDTKRLGGVDSLPIVLNSPNICGPTRNRAITGFIEPTAEIMRPRKDSSQSAGLPQSALSPFPKFLRVNRGIDDLAMSVSAVETPRKGSYSTHLIQALHPHPEVLLW